MKTPDTYSSNKHLRRSRLLRIFGIAAGLPLLFLLLMASISVDIDIGSQRASMARLVSAQMGREIRIDGALYLRVGLRPQLASPIRPRP